ncbi:MAG: hypothetical protein U0Q11_00825 [Vicinamibacterales bacterium]
MRRTYYSYLPVLVAGVVFTLASTSVRAQQAAHPSDDPTAPACACCGNSGGAAMNHEAGGGCCGNMAMAAPTTGTSDPAATHDHANMTAAAAGAAPSVQVDHAAMGHDMAAMAATDTKMAGCCDHMAMDHTADKAAPSAMNHEAAGGCCGDMAMNMKTDSAQPPAKAADAASMFGAMSGCSAGTATSDANAKPMDHGAAGCCADMAK